MKYLVDHDPETQEPVGYWWQEENHSTVFSHYSRPVFKESTAHFLGFDWLYEGNPLNSAQWESTMNRAVNTVSPLRMFTVVTEKPKL